MQHDIDKPRNQTTLVPKEIVESRYVTVLSTILDGQKEIANEALWLRHSYEDQVNQLFDLTELIGRLAAKIEEWIGVAEE